MAGAENQVLPVQRVEATTDDIDISAMFGQLYARHRPRIRRIAHARVDGSLRAAEAGPLNAGLLRRLGFDYAAEAGVTPRAPQYAFRRHYDTAPMSSPAIPSATAEP